MKIVPENRFSGKTYFYKIASRESIENWDKRPQIADVIVKKGPFLKLYTSYMKEFQSAMEHYSVCCSKYPEFGAVVRKFEARESCRGLKLEHYLLKPVQRLPQYKLLLESYLKHLSPTSADYKPATEAHSIVTKAAAHANEQIKQDVSRVRGGNLFRRFCKLFSLSSP